jgi:hypothetical protein
MITAAVVHLAARPWLFAALGGWAVAAATHLGWTWQRIHGVSAGDTTPS